MKSNLILDVDGVILKWESNIVKHFDEMGYDTTQLKLAIDNREYFDLAELLNEPHTKNLELIESYNGGKYGSSLEPIENAVDSIKMLSRVYKIHIVSCYGSTKKCVQNRLKNLNEIFGKNFFSSIHVIGVYSSKRPILKNYKVGVFIDDSPNHVKSGLKAGHESIRFVNDMRPIEDNYLYCLNWNEIFNFLMNEYGKQSQIFI